MLTRGHRLEVGPTSIVGNVAETGKVRIALDIGTDAAFFDNPDLPNIRSQMALPLNIHSETIGVLDVQSTKPGAFSENDANILGILADQVAIAVENARLFGQTQQALSEVQALYAQFLQQEWRAFDQQESRWLSPVDMGANTRPQSNRMRSTRRCRRERLLFWMGETAGLSHPSQYQ
jgi:GAF domain-containing protein